MERRVELRDDPAGECHPHERARAGEPGSRSARPCAPCAGSSRTSSGDARPASGPTRRRSPAGRGLRVRPGRRLPRRRPEATGDRSEREGSSLGACRQARCRPRDSRVECASRNAPSSPRETRTRPSGGGRRRSRDPGQSGKGTGDSASRRRCRSRDTAAAPRGTRRRRHRATEAACEPPPAGHRRTGASRSPPGDLGLAVTSQGLSAAHRRSATEEPRTWRPSSSPEASAGEPSPGTPPSRSPSPGARVRGPGPDPDLRALQDTCRQG